MARTSKTKFGFDARLPEALKVAKGSAAARVVETSRATRAVLRAVSKSAAVTRAVTKETKAALRSVVVRAFHEQIPPYDAARTIKSLIGLDERRAHAAMNYRDSLVNSGTSLERVNALVDKYALKLLGQRAMTIARTETMQALNEGAVDAWSQAQDEGFLTPKATKEWIVTPDDITCVTICDPMDGATAPLDGTFHLPSGEDVEEPPAHPNCRCTLAVNP